MRKPEQLDIKKDAKWYADNGRYFNENIELIKTNKIERRLSIASCDLKEIDYEYVTNPYGDLIDKKDLPAKLKNIDILSPIINQLIGEYLIRPIEPLVYNKNSDLNSKRMQLKHQLTVETVQQQFVNTLIQMGMYVPGQTDEEGKPIQEPMSYEKINEKVTNVLDEHTINGQYRLDYVFNTKNIKSELKSIFYYYFAAGIGLSYRDIVDNDIVYKLIKPKDFGYMKADGIRFIEDSLAVKSVNKIQYSDLLVLFQDDEEFNKIKDDIKTNISRNIPYSYESIFNHNFYGRDASVENIGELEKDEVYLTHIQWKGLSYMYRKYITEPTGRRIHIDLDERYEPLEGEDIEKRIVVTPYEVYVINDRYYVGGKEIEHSRGDFDNPNYCKLSYNGIEVQSYLDRASTIIDKLDQYQKDYNIIKFVIHKKILKNKGKLTSMPLSLLNGFKETKVQKQRDSEGREFIEVKTNKTKSAVAEALYFADATEFLIIDDSELDYARAQIASTLLKSIDLSLANEIEYLYNYAARIKEEAYEYIGFNRGRRGNTQEREAVYNTKNGQQTGQLMTEELFEDFRLFQDSEFSALLDLANYLYKDGLKGQYLTSDYMEHLIDVPPVGISSASLGVLCRSGGKDKENFDILKENIQAITQNGYTPYMLATLLSKSSNFDKLRMELKKLEEEQANRQAAAQQELNAIEARKIDLEQQKIDIEKLKVIGELQLGSAKLGIEVNTQGGNSGEIIKLINENSKANTDNMFKLADLKLKAAKLETDKYKADRQFDIAKENKP